MSRLKCPFSDLHCKIRLGNNCTKLFVHLAPKSEDLGHNLLRSALKKCPGVFCRVHMKFGGFLPYQNHMQNPFIFTEQSVENSKLTINRILRWIKTLPLGFSPYLTTSNPLRKVHVFNYTVSALSCLND